MKTKYRVKFERTTTWGRETQSGGEYASREAADTAQANLTARTDVVRVWIEEKEARHGTTKN